MFNLLATLILEEQSIDSMVKFMKNSYFKETHNSQSAAQSIIPPLYRTSVDHSISSLK